MTICLVFCVYSLNEDKLYTRLSWNLIFLNFLINKIIILLNISRSVQLHFDLAMCSDVCLTLQCVQMSMSGERQKKAIPFLYLTSQNECDFLKNLFQPVTNAKYPFLKYNFKSSPRLMSTNKRKWANDNKFLELCWWFLQNAFVHISSKYSLYDSIRTGNEIHVSECNQPGSALNDSIFNNIGDILIILLCQFLGK